MVRRLSAGALKGSALALDFYLWLCHEADRAHRSGKDRFIAWSQLMQQFGTGWTNPKRFEEEARQAAKPRMRPKSASLIA
jgi:hypothetical protein